MHLRQLCKHDLVYASFRLQKLKSPFSCQAHLSLFEKNNCTDRSFSTAFHSAHVGVFSVRKSLAKPIFLSLPLFCEPCFAHAPILLKNRIFLKLKNVASEQREVWRGLQRARKLQHKATSTLSYTI